MASAKGRNCVKPQSDESLFHLWAESVRHTSKQGGKAAVGVVVKGVEGWWRGRGHESGTLHCTSC